MSSLKITPIGDVIFTPSARRFINRSKRNKLFYKKALDRYAVQDWGDSHEMRWSFNNFVMERERPSDIEAKYVVPDETGHLVLFGFNDLNNRMTTTVNFIPFPAEKEEKKRGKLIQLKILY